MAAKVPPAFVLRPLLATRNGLARLHRAMVPPEVAVLELSLGIIDTKALAVVAELGVADQLADAPRTAAELASACGANEDALGRVLRYLVGRGLFRTARGDRYRNNRASSLLRSDRPATLRPWARFFGSDWHVAIWNELESSVRTGGAAAEPALGHPFWEYLTETRPEAGEMFDEAMASASSLQMEVIARKYDFKGCRRVCDVGGGTGTLLAAILNANSHLEGVLFDLPAVVARAAPVLTAAGVSERVEVVGGDFFESVPEGCDRYVLEAIVHDWDDESCVTFLGRCREAMPPDGRVLVLEQLLPKHSGDHPVKAVDLEMLVDTGRGRERTQAEFDVLFSRAGFAVRRVIPIALSSVFELVQAP
jgi:predicted O-methyltransferase YrrM